MNFEVYEVLHCVILIFTSVENNKISAISREGYDYSFKTNSVIQVFYCYIGHNTKTNDASTGWRLNMIFKESY